MRNARSGAAAFAVSLDLDEVFRHLAIHGRRPARGATPHEERAAFRFGLPRALAWARREQLPLTLFAVSEDARDPFVAEALRTASREGHPVESHSRSHPYDLVRLDPAQQRLEILGSVQELEAVVGDRPEGFRAPGYLVDDVVFDAIEAAGLRFDASLLPCPAYVGAKVAILGAMALRGRKSASLPRGGRMALAPRLPYRPGRPFHRRGERPFVELPVSVSRLARLPALGTLVGALPGALARGFARGFASDGFVSLELHAVDFLEPSDPGVGPLVGLQPELRRPVAEREGSLSAFVAELRRWGLAPTTLREAARVFQATLRPGS